MIARGAAPILLVLVARTLSAAADVPYPSRPVIGRGDTR
jgi:hypothetical protein